MIKGGASRFTSEIPSNLKDEFLNDFINFMDEIYVAPQQSDGKVKSDCSVRVRNDFLLLIAEKTKSN